jgi:sodium/bile acid cotransporter 7
MTGRTIDNPELSLGKMASDLGLLVVLPMAVAQATRLHPWIARKATAHKSSLSMLAQCGILSMIFFGAIGTGLRLRESSLEPALAWDLVTMLAAVLLVHLGMFWAALTAGRWMGFSREDQIAVGFSGSQKTLMIGLLMAMSLQISILPMVTYHILQLIVDTVIADHFRRQTAAGAAI